MSKIILAIMLFTMFSGQVLACENETKVKATIDYVYYDEASQSYMAITLPDDAEGFWTVIIDNDEQLTLDELKKRYKGKEMVIVYSGNLEVDNEIEIVSTEFMDH